MMERVFLGLNFASVFVCYSKKNSQLPHPCLSSMLAAKLNEAPPTAKGLIVAHDRSLNTF
jgi:hypothetical protein